MCIELPRVIVELPRVCVCMARVSMRAACMYELRVGVVEYAADAYPLYTLILMGNLPTSMIDMSLHVLRLCGLSCGKADPCLTPISNVSEAV